jgi:hypothetical protein
MSDQLPQTAVQLDQALAHSLTSSRAKSPGVAVVEEALTVLERRGQAEMSRDGWLLTKAGMQLYYSLEDRFENSGQRGDYGF